VKLYEEMMVKVVSDVKCDVCGASTLAEHGVINAGTLQATWGFGSNHDGDRYEIDLCEVCFFDTLSHLKRERQSPRLFTDEAENSPAGAEEFGLVSKENL
jgi:hypothetical protein